MTTGRWMVTGVLTLIATGLVASEAKPAAAKPATPRPAVLAAMVPIPAGEFVMGHDEAGHASPAHTVRISAFEMDNREVTNAEYFRFCQATGRELPFFWGMREFRSGLDFPDHPVVGVTWNDASEYAAWSGKRLPTEAEWEYAARAGLVGKRFTTGDDLAKTDANFAGSGPVTVASYPPNAYGLYDMAGNVAEWVADRYDARYYQTSPRENPKGPEDGEFRVVRGGGWHGGKMCANTTGRVALKSSWVNFAVGFRCARDVSTPATPPTR